MGRITLHITKLATSFSVSKIDNTYALLLASTLVTGFQDTHDICLLSLFPRLLAWLGLGGRESDTILGHSYEGASGVAWLVVDLKVEVEVKGGLVLRVEPEVKEVRPEV